jgi:hypothetical protein
MKKAKVTRKPLSRSDFTLYPSRLRMVTIYGSFFALAVIVGLLIRLATSGANTNYAELFIDWQMNLAIVVGGAVLFAILDFKRWTIRVISGELVEGPSGALGDRVKLEIKDIDWERSGRSLNSRLKVGNAIYTLGRQRILISPWFYPSNVFSEFLEHIGYREK